MDTIPPPIPGAKSVSVNLFFLIFSMVSASHRKGRTITHAVGKEGCVMTSLRKNFYLGFLLVLMLPVIASALERQRGTIRKTGDVLCLYHCDDYYLEPDPG